MLAIITNFFLKLSSVFLKPLSCIKGQSIAEFAVITAMMSTFVATAAPRLSNLMEEGKTQKSIQEIDKLLMQAKNFYEFTSKLEGRGRLPGQDKFDIPVGGYTDTLEVYNDLVYFTSFDNDSIGPKWVSVFGNHDGSLFQDDEYLPELDKEGNIQCDNCPESREAGMIEWYHLFNQSILESPFQDGHYVYQVVAGSGHGSRAQAPILYVADIENPSEIHAVLQP